MVDLRNKRQEMLHKIKDKGRVQMSLKMLTYVNGTNCDYLFFYFVKLDSR